MIRLALGAAIFSFGAMLAVGACGNGQFDGAASTTDAQADVQTDVQEPDASPISDGGTTKVDADSLPKPAPIDCADAGLHTLCDTFDETKLSSFWNVNVACSSPVLDTTNSVSSPSSLSTNDLKPGPNCASVYASVPSVASTKFSGSFDLYLDTPSSKLAPFFAIWVTTSDYSFYEIALTTDTSGTINVLENLNVTPDAGSTFDITPINAAILALDGWNNVAISINFVGANMLSVSLNGGTPLTLALQHRPSAGSISGYRVYLGIPNGGDTKAAAHFDDFVCDVTP